MDNLLVSYDDSDEDHHLDENENDKVIFHKTPKFTTTIDTAPAVDGTMVRSELASKLDGSGIIDLYNTKELTYNPKYENLYAPTYGPNNPSKPNKMVKKNFLTGTIEPAFVSDTNFELERKTFHAYGAAANPSDSSSTNDLVSKPGGSTEPPRERQKRKKIRNMDSSDVDGYTGPWAEFENEIKVSKPTEEEAQELVEILAKRRNTNAASKSKQSGVEEEFKERAVLHIKDPYDYQGRSFLHPPHDVNVPLHKPDHRQIDIKLWEVYHERRCVMTYHGHKQAIRDICFNRSGERFISAGYDRFIKLWDTETGQCVRKFSNRKIAYCVRFNTSDEAHSHYFLSGMSDKKILCWDTRSGNICQEYDRHLGAVNTVTLVDGGRRFVSTSDDKSLRVWDWDIPVDVKYIAEPAMHAIPAVSPAPNGKWLACQSMDNKIQAFACMNRFKLNQKKVFTGHMVAGYACSPDFSPDMSYLISGDADGKLFIWDWKTTKLLNTIQAHDNVCISALWHPHETSKVITAGWDNVIKLWD
ncbi:hypothetical protein RDWZM_003250 [Blomia tropicalis]|uniref:Pre-mRNA-processing factor 17 n=1 Tax=Blomia tropicalis TaxID=40697 RepID=A0A9Q0MJ75_BLOTA|nr:hypothetical protein RDWZM_003250 [Blomia tropicalis]